MTDLLAPLAYGALTWAAGDSVISAATAVTLATQGLLPFLSRFAIARARGASADVYGVGVSGVLERGRLIGGRGF